MYEVKEMTLFRKNCAMYFTILVHLAIGRSPLKVLHVSKQFILSIEHSLRNFNK